MARDKEYVLLQQDENDAVARSPPIPLSLSWLPITFAGLLFVVLSAFFRLPSTLYIYLAILLTYSTMGVISIIGKALFKQQRLPFTPTMGIAIALLALPLCIPSPMSSAPILRASRSQHGTLLVAANLYNSETILPRFTASLYELAESVGYDNLFISIYESNSEDQTKSMLSDFDVELTRRSIPHLIKMENVHNHIGVHGNFDRIAFLADVRNKVYEALDVGEGLKYKSRVDRVVWLNDVIFDSGDVLKLLDTNGGDFDVACGIDHIPLGMYDT
jgi:alpha-1,3-mannosyltransferase